MAKNHGYVDGNKRIAFAAATAFLRANGVRLLMDPGKAYDYVMGVVEDRHSETELAQWIARNSEPARQENGINNDS